MSTAAWQERRLLSFDQTPLFYRRLELAQSAKAFLVCVHGMGEHGGRYRSFAEYLGEMGIESLMPDLRGFGQSGGRRGFIRSYNDFHRDLEAMIAILRRDSRNLPIFLFGHSFGGLLVSSYLAFNSAIKIKGLILSSPLFGVAISVPIWRHWLAQGAALVWPAYTQETPIVATMLTHDKAILKQYESDKLIHRKISAKLYSEMAYLIRKKNKIAAQLKRPTLILQAGEDVVVNRQDTENFYTHLAALDKEIEIYPDLYHEILNEIEREKVKSRIGLWITKQI